MRAASSGVRPSSSASGSSAQPSGTSTRYFITRGYATELPRVSAVVRDGTVPRSCVASRSRARSPSCSSPCSAQCRAGRPRRPRCASPRSPTSKASPPWRHGPAPGRCTSPQQDGVVRSLRDGKASADAGHRPAGAREPGRRRARAARPRLLARRHAALRALQRHRRRHPGRPVRDDAAAAPIPRRRKSILHVEQPQPNHNGGQLAFGPDGYLYLGLGDGGNAGDAGPGHAPGGNGQSLGTLLGKILRIDPNPSPGDPAFTVPADNPFVGTRRAPNPRSGRTACATRGGSRSTARPATSGSATSVRTSTRRSTTCRRRTVATPARATTSAGTGSKATTPTRATHRPTSIGSGVRDRARHRRVLGRSAGSCTGARRSPRSTAPTSSATTATAPSGCSNPTATACTLGRLRVEASAVSSFGQANNGTLYVVSLTDGVFRIDPA